MKKVHKSLLWSIVGLFVLAFNPVVKAQDDLYYDPATDAPVTKVVTHTEVYQDNNNVTERFNDDEYYEEDDYAYEYSSRVRRFHRSTVVTDYYDPFFVDLYNYDPFYSPGSSIYVYNYNDYWSYRRWRNWNRWNSGYYNGWAGYSFGYSPWGWNSCYTYSSPWYNPWVVNNYYYDPYWTCNGYNPYYQDNYCGNGWGGNCGNYYYSNSGGHQNGGYSPQTYVGPRRNGSHVSNPGYARIPDSNGRLASSETNVPLVKPSTPRVGRTGGDYDPGSVGRGKPASDRSMAPTTGGRRPEGTATDATGRSRTPDTAPTGRGVETTPSRGNVDTYKPRTPEVSPSRTETPQRSNNEGYKPRRTEEAPATRPQRVENPTPRSGNQEGNYTPRRTESAPSRNEESRPVRRSEERTYERPTRSNNNGGGGFSQEAPRSRSMDSGSSIRSSSGNSGNSSNSGSSSRSSSGGSSNSGGSSTKSSGGGRGGRG